MKRLLASLGLMAVTLLWQVSGLDIHRSLAPLVSTASSGPVTWTHLTSGQDGLPDPTRSSEQTAALVFDINGDGTGDFVIGSRKAPGPSVVWYERVDGGWRRYLIDDEPLRVEAGGAFADIDGDGDLDLALGGDGQSNEMWWWENPSPNFDPDKGWARRLIKRGGPNRHHDMMFGNFDEDPAAELVFWNQGAHGLFMVDVPADPKGRQPWPGQARIATVQDPERGFHEGLAQWDFNGDGKMDIAGGGRWYEQVGHFKFREHVIDDATDTRIAVGQIIPGGWPEVVLSPGDVAGMARWYQYDDPGWIEHELLPVDHAHTLELGDINQDGNLDIFMAEMRFDVGGDRHNPEARMLALTGNGKGGFDGAAIANGYGNHESRLADLDGDGDLDILGKPYNWDTPRLDIWLNDGDDEPPPPPPCEDGTTTWETRVVDHARPSRAVFIDAADLDGDGYQDLVAGAWWYHNPGTIAGTWERRSIGDPLGQMAVLADFDKDGDADILGTVTPNADKPWLGDSFVWARNDGQGEFTLIDNIDAGNGDFLQGAVISGDGSRVYLSWHREGTALQTLRVPGDPSSTRWSIGNASVSQSEDLSLGDVDGDGDEDLLTGTRWLEWTGPDEWLSHTLSTTDEKPDRNALVDVNNDGRLDAIVGFEAISKPGRLVWYEQPENEDGIWAEHLIATVTGPMSLDVADINGDGTPDVAVGEHNLANPESARLLVYLNDGGSGETWTEVVAGKGYEHHDGAQTADLDNDGDLDMFSIGWGHDKVLAYEQHPCEPEAQASAAAARQTTPRPAVNAVMARGR